MSIIEFANTSQIFSSERFSELAKSAAALIRSGELHLKDVNSSSEDVNELADMLDAVASGRRVDVVPPHAELTIREASDILLISEPFLNSLLDADEIPHQKLGNQRRIKSDDLLAFKSERQRLHMEAVDELVEEGQLLNPNY
ncbi:MAG TPA: hypothetical protein DEB39_02645 [Planctomycetaceae bacterium]|nr:hypothetical protein [Planctomycetaceae bacterium]